jgi:hypothetical protein
MDISYAIPTERFARCIATSKRVRWDIEADVIRDRRLDRASKFLPDGLSLAGRLDFLSPSEKLYFSQVQGRTYANMFEWSSASSAPKCWKSAATTGWATKLLSRPWSG